MRTHSGARRVFMVSCSSSAIEVAQSTVARYMCRHSRPPSQGWRTFPQQSPTASRRSTPCPADDRIPNSVLFGHCAPRTTTLGVVWRDGKPNGGVDLAPGHRGAPVGPASATSVSGSRHLVWSSLFAAADLHNGHSGPSDRTTIALAKMLTLSGSAGSIRRECLDHMIVFGEAHLRRVLRGYGAYYNGSRTHRSLNKDAPLHRAIERLGAVVSRPVLGCLHHQYCRI